MTNYLCALIARLRGLFGDRKADREFDDDIQAHLELLTERYLRQGMPQAEAASAARRQFGNVTIVKEANRQMRGIRFIETIFQDLRYGLWMLRRNPGFAFVVVLTLALGIGANTAIFSVVNAVLLRSLPYRDPDRLVMLSTYREQVGGDGTSGMDFLVWRDQAKSFEKTAAFWSGTFNLTGSGKPERVNVGTVSTDLFATLGFAPSLGRTFTPEEDTAGGPPVAILSDGLWRSRFGGDPQVIGRTLTIEDRNRTIVGVMPPGFRFPEESDLWLPLALDIAKEMGGEEGAGVKVIARLKPGVPLEAARADLSVILNQQRQAFPNNYADIKLRVTGLSESLIGNVRLALLILFGAVSFVLLIACANVANLLLARSAARQKEMAIRAAIGAGRLRLVRQLLTESLLLSLAGGAAGLLAAKWCVKLLVVMSPGGIARIEESRIDGRVFGFTCGVVVLVALIAGILPALQASKADINETLKEKSTARSGRSSYGGVRQMLPAVIIAELALALILLAGAGLMIKSFVRLLAVPSGFNPNGVLTLALSPSSTSYPERSPQRLAYFQEALARAKAIPGIHSASLVSFLPLTGNPFGTSGKRFIEGRPPVDVVREQSVEINYITPDYFQTMAIEMRAGRLFVPQDSNGAPRVAIVNEMLVRRFLHNENPIGHRLLVKSPRPTIVGVVGDTRHHGLDQEVLPEIYLPYSQYPGFADLAGLNLAVRVVPSQNNPTGLSSLAVAIRNQVSAIDSNELVNQVITMDERLSNSFAQRRYQTLLLGIFAVIALVIATVGIYGVISYAVSQRTHEIGIRMALGAQAGDVLKMVIWRGMSLALIGVALGLAAALALTRVMKTLLFEVSATDPATFAIIALLLVCVALIASYIPARRATKVDPLQALRHE
jgi:putative ABC transport system permease protein